MKYKAIILILLIFIMSCKNSEDKKQIAIASEQNPELSKSIKRGAMVYKNFCVVCHLPNGKGIEGSFPPLANSDYLKNNQNKSIKAIKYGVSGEMVVNGKTYNNIMTPLGLTDKEVADVMNYINHSWENSFNTLITEEEVSKIKP